MTEINAGSIAKDVYDTPTLEEMRQQDQTELNKRARVAAFFGTLQAGITDFHYLRTVWKHTTEKDALIGVGITGICNGDILNLNLNEASKIAIEENQRVSVLIGINPAARVTTIKPSGTTSCVVGTSSGIHAWHSKFYIRNMQTAVGSDLYNYFTKYHPGLIKVMDYDPESAVIGIPQKAPDTAVLREHENAVQMLGRVFRFYDEWVKPGSLTGSNTNNVSATVYMKEDEWAPVGEVLWKNRHKFNGMSCLPYDGGTYRDAPFQECTEEEYLAKLPLLDSIDLSRILEEDDNTDLSAEAACSGSSCEVK